MSGRWLPTAGKTDTWSIDQGHVGAVKRFAAFVYGPDTRPSTTYDGLIHVSDYGAP